MQQWCPYSNIRTHVEYPHTFVMSGYNDQLVAFWEGLKFTHKLRDAQNGLEFEGDMWEDAEEEEEVEQEENQEQSLTHNKRVECGTG
mmetsp:Transcript_7392/g.15707  ORF Transcript_7392/g.15707 Transcript_7392/m.15707 type:complete len:87 (-) Transcript_7392:159-419(-)